MHLQLLHASTFSITSLEASTRPHTVCSVRSGSAPRHCQDCLVVFTSIEKGDTCENVDRAAAEIVKVANRLRREKPAARNPCTSIVLVPYSHQRNVETDGRRALRLIRALHELLSSQSPGLNVFMCDFGFSNEWSISVKSHRLSCLYREC